MVVLVLLVALLGCPLAQSAPKEEEQKVRPGPEAAAAGRPAVRLMRSTQERRAALLVSPGGEIQEVKEGPEERKTERSSAEAPWVESADADADADADAFRGPPAVSAALDSALEEQEQEHEHAGVLGSASARDLGVLPPQPPQTARVVKSHSKSDNIHGVTVAAFAMAGNTRSLTPGSLLLSESEIFAREEIAQERARRCPSLPSRLNFTVLSSFVQMTEGIVVTLNLKLQTGGTLPNVKVEWTQEPQPQSLAALAHMRQELRPSQPQPGQRPGHDYSRQLEKYAKLILPKDACDFSAHLESKSLTQAVVTTALATAPGPAPGPGPESVPEPGPGPGPGPGLASPRVRVERQQLDEQVDGQQQIVQRQRQQQQQQKLQQFLLSPPLGVEVKTELAAYREGLKGQTATATAIASTLPSSFSWQQASPKCINYVHHQGSCGSCYMFASIDSLSDRHCINQHSNSSLGNVDHLSVQMGLLCEPLGRQCAGGWADVGFKYAMQVGINTERRWPYERSCLSDSVCQFGSQCVGPYTHECADFFSPAQLDLIETYADALTQTKIKCKTPEVQQSQACGDWAGKTFGDEVDEVFAPSRDWCGKVLAEFRAFLHPTPGPGPGPGPGPSPSPPCPPTPTPAQAVRSASPGPTPSPTPSPTPTPTPAPRGPEASLSPSVRQWNQSNASEAVSGGNGSHCRALFGDSQSQLELLLQSQPATLLRQAQGRCLGLPRQAACEQWLSLALKGLFAPAPSPSPSPSQAAFFTPEDLCAQLLSQLETFSLPVALAQGGGDGDGEGEGGEDAAVTAAAAARSPRTRMRMQMLLEEGLGEGETGGGGGAEERGEWIWQWWSRRRRRGQAQDGGGFDTNSSSDGASGASALTTTKSTTTTSALTMAQLCDRNRCKVLSTPHTLKNYHYIDNVLDTFKREVYNDGPFYTSFYVYEDFTWFFRSYPTHAYNHQWGRSLGGHAVVLLGWEASCTYHDGTSALEQALDDATLEMEALAARAERHQLQSSANRRRTATGSCWHLRNSWGDGWGDKGYFRMREEMLTGPDGTHIHIASAAADGANSESL